MLASEWECVGSRLSLIVPVNRVASWSITVMLFLSLLILYYLRLVPSIWTIPRQGSTNLRIVEKIEVFPAPVLPTMPIFSPALTLKVKS